MTCYNSAAFIGKAAQSVLSQDWKDLELVIVDDASTDDSVDVIREIANADPRVHCLLLKENKGTYNAKNLGIELAKGQVVTFMDSDDWCARERIGSQLGALRETGAVSSSCNYVRVDADGRERLNRGLRERRALISLMVKREVLEEIGMFDSVRTSADDEFFERLRLVYGRDAHRDVQAPLYFALVRSDSLSGDARNPVSLDADGEAPALSRQRQTYVESYSRWHRRCIDAGRRPFMPFPPPLDRAFPTGLD